MLTGKCEPLSAESSFSARMEKNKALTKEKVFQKSRSMGIAVVRLKDMPTPDNKGTMLLSNRQRQWMQTPCYDVYTENPVQHKYLQDATKPSKERMEEEEERIAVLRLSDQPIPQPPTGIIEQIAKKKRIEHMQLAIYFEEELTSNSNALEDLVKLASENARVKLSENAAEIDKVFSEAYVPKKLHELNMKDLVEVWNRISEVFSVRRVIVKGLEDELNATELERVKVMQEILKRYASKLKKVAYLLPDQLDHLMEKEGVAVNLSIVANKKQYARLYSLVLKESLTMEKDLRKKWDDMVDEWKDIVCEKIRGDFSQFMSSKMVANTDEEEILKDQFHSRLQIVERKRAEVMERMGNISPPNVNIGVLEKLKEELSNVYNEFNRVHSEYLFQLHSFLESVQHKCEAKMDSIRNNLLKIEAYDSCSSYELIMTEFLPQVDQHTSKMRDKTSTLEKALDSIFSTQKEKFVEVFEFIRGLSLLWTSHVSDLESCRRELTEGLDEIRSAHDGINQNLEANLDVVLDRLRQSATQETLERYMKEGLSILDTIRNGYDTFKTGMIAEVEAYPSTVQEYLDYYEASLLQLLGVKHIIPSSAPAQRIISSDSRSKLTSSKKVIRTSRGHTYVRIDDIPRSGSEIGEKDKEGSGSTKRRSRTGDISESQGQGGRSKKDKVRFDTKADAVDEEEGEVKGKGEKEGSGGDKNIKRLDKGDKKRRSSKDSGNKKGKGRRGSKKTAASSGVRDAREDRVQNGSSKDGKEQVKQKNVSDKEEEESTKGTFMTQNEEMEEEVVMVAVTLKESALQQILHGIQWNFLEHLDLWKTTQVESAAQVVTEKKEEMLTELDLRLHLHEPRSMRITKDIHDIRAAELVVHGERVNRHAEAIAEALSDLKEAPAVTSAKLEEKVVNFTAEIASITFSGVSNLKLLEKLKEDTHKAFLNHMEHVSLLCEEHIMSTMAKFDVISCSNTKYRASIKLFKEGGNYCPEEVDVFCRKLEKIGEKINSSQRSTQVNLTQTEEEYLTKSCEVMDDFKEVCDVYLEEFTFVSCWKKSIVSLHVLLKGEVAGCYAQAKSISLETQALRDAIDRTRGKDFTPAMLMAMVSELFELLSERTRFLQANQTPEDLRDMQEEGGAAKKPISTINIIQSITGHHASTAASKASPLSADKRKKSTLKPPGQAVNQCDQTREQLSSKDSAQPKLNSHSSILSKHKLKKKSILDKFGGETSAKDASNVFLSNIKRILRAKVTELGKEAENFYLVRNQNVSGQPKISLRQVKSSHVPHTIDIFLGLVEEEIDKHLSQAEEQRWKFIKELKVQCEEVTSVVIKVPDVVFAEARESHCKAALACWQDASARFTFDMDQLHQKRVLLERRLKPSFGRPDRTSALEELNVQEDKLHNEALKTLDNFGKEACKDQQALFCEFLQHICEITKSLLTLMDGVTPAQKIKEDPRLPKVRPKMEDLIRKNVSENVVEATRTVPTSHSPTRHNKQDVVVTKCSSGDVATPRKGSDGSQTPVAAAAKRRKSSVTKSMINADTRPTIGSASLGTFKNNWFHWNQLPYHVAAEFLSASRPGSKQSMVGSSHTIDRRKGVASPHLPNSVILEMLKDMLKTKKSTEVHEVVVICRDKEFEKFTSQHREIFRQVESTEEAGLEVSHKAHQQWNTSIKQIKQLYTI